jgi:hypothetical protein
MLASVSQGLLLAVVLLNAFMYDLYDLINHSNCLLFVEDLNSIELLIHILVVHLYTHLLCIQKMFGELYEA